MTQAERDRIILDYTQAVYAQPGITPEVAASQIAQAMDQFGVSPQEYAGAFQRDTTVTTPEQRAVFGDVGTVQQTYEAVRPTGQYSSSAPRTIINAGMDDYVRSDLPYVQATVTDAAGNVISGPGGPTREEVIRNYVDALYKTPGITSEEAALNLSQKMDEVGVSPQEFASAFANTEMFTPEQRDVFGNVDVVQTVYNQYNPTGLYSTLSRDTGTGTDTVMGTGTDTVMGTGTDTVTGTGTDTVTGGGYVGVGTEFTRPTPTTLPLGLVSESTASLPYGGGFYKRTPEEQALYEQEYRGIPVTTTVPTPVIAGTTGISPGMAPFVAPGGPGEEAGYARIREILGSGDYTLDELRAAKEATGVSDQDIDVAFGRRVAPIRMPTPTLPGSTAGTTQSINEFIRSKAPTATPPITPSMFSPENVRNQLELEQLRSGFTPKNRLTDLYGSFLGTQGDINRVIQENRVTADQLKTMYGVGDPEINAIRASGITPYTEPTPVAGFAQGGLVSDDINRMLQNQRNAIQRESQSRQMLTNLGAPPVKKFSDGGPAGSSSGVRRLEMSGYQAGGEVSKERSYEEMHPRVVEEIERRRDQSRMISGGVRSLLKNSDAKSSTAQGLVNPQLLTDPYSDAEGYVIQSGSIKDEYANQALPDEIFLRKNVEDPALVLSHEANHILARKQLGYPTAVNQKFDELIEKRGAREKFVRDAADAYPYLKEKYGVNAAYFQPKMLKIQEKAGKLPVLLYEQIATLAAIEDTQGVDLTKDPVLRKTLFKDRNVRETYNALTGLRMTRMDRHDIKPMTRVPEKGSEKEAGLTDRIKKMLGFSEGGDVSNDEFIQEMMTGTRPTDQEAFVERTSDVLSKTPKSQELANQIRNLFQSLETPSPSAQEEYLERRPTPESREPIRSRKAMEAFLKAANPRLEIEERPLPGGKFGFVRADDPDTLVISTRQFPAQREETAFHELEHSLSERGGNPLGKLSKEGKPIVMDNNYRFDVLYNQDKKIGGEGRFARFDMMNRFIKNKDKLEKFFGRPFDSNYFSREPESGLFAEQIADLSALEQVTNKSLTRDPEMRKLLFPDDKAAAVYDAITGLRQTRLDAKDLPPYTPNYPEEKSMMDWIRGKLGMDKK